MTFILKMAWRDSRAARGRLVLFTVSIVLGIAALVAIGSFAANLAQAIEVQAKGLLGADLGIVARAAPASAVQAFIDGLGGEQAHELGFSSMLMFPKADNLTRLVQVRAMDGAFPFYGDFTTDPVDAPAKFRAAQAGIAPDAVAIVEETLLRQFDAKVGDPIKLGNATFTVIGALKKLPG